jgi:hypothetical protein
MIARCYTTRTGLRIGIAYMKPPARMQGDAVKVQAALLEPRTARPMSRLRLLVGRAVAWL